MFKKIDFESFVALSLDSGRNSTGFSASNEYYTTKRWWFPPRIEAVLPWTWDFRERRTDPLNSGQSCETFNLGNLAKSAVNYKTQGVLCSAEFVEQSLKGKRDWCENGDALFLPETCESYARRRDEKYKFRPDTTRDLFCGKQTIVLPELTLLNGQGFSHIADALLTRKEVTVRLMGDSTMRELFYSLLCELNQMQDMEHVKGSTLEDAQCKDKLAYPFGQKNDLYLKREIHTKFRRISTGGMLTIKFVEMGQAAVEDPDGFLSFCGPELDVFVFNFGPWYNHWGEYMYDMNKLAELLKRCESKSFVYLSTGVQHFPNNERYGYFKNWPSNRRLNSKRRQLQESVCAANVLQDDEYLDIRSFLLKKVFESRGWELKPPHFLWGDKFAARNVSGKNKARRVLHFVPRFDLGLPLHKYHNLDDRYDCTHWRPGLWFSEFTWHCIARAVFGMDRNQRSPGSTPDESSASGLHKVHKFWIGDVLRNHDVPCAFVRERYKRYGAKIAGPINTTRPASFNFVDKPGLIFNHSMFHIHDFVRNRNISWDENVEELRQIHVFFNLTFGV